MAQSIARTKHRANTKAKGQRAASRSRRSEQGIHGLLPMTGLRDERIEPRRNTDPLEARSAAQGNYIRAIETNILTFGVGPAGTGKTYVAVTIAADALAAGEVDRIIITRPIVEAGEKIGFLPGEMMEKVGPYMTPVMSVLEKRLGKGAVEFYLQSGRIEVLPLAFMRGRSLANAFVILDEAQNTTVTQMKMFLTRMEEGCRIVVDGDPRQCDLPSGTRSGLADALDRVSRLRGVDVVRFTKGDVVRSGLVQDIVNAYESPEDEAAVDDAAGLKCFLSNA